MRSRPVQAPDDVLCHARALMRARQLGGEIKYLTQGEIEARNRGYSPYSVETWRSWEY